MGDGLLSGLGSFGLDGLEGMSLFDDEGGAVYASFAREVEIYETVIADLQELEQRNKKSKSIKRA